MSEQRSSQDQESPNTASVELGPHYYIVQDHSIHVLAVNDQGRRFRLGALKPSSVIAPVKDGPRLVAVMHPGARLVRIEPRDFDPEELAAWCDLLARAVHDDDAKKSILDADRQRVGEAAAAHLHAELDRRAEDERQSLFERSRADEAAIAETRERSLSTIRSPNTALPPASRSSLFACMNEIANAQGFKALDGKPQASSGSEAVQAMAHAARVRGRSVRLDEDWIRNPSTPLLGFVGTEEDVEAGTAEPIALIPKFGRYRVFRPEAPQVRPKLTKELADSIAPNAWEFIIPFAADKEVRYRDVAKLALRGFGGAWIWIAFASLAVSLLALVGPALTKQIMSVVVPQGRSLLLLSIGTTLAVVAIISSAYSIVQSLTLARITQKSQLRVQAAVWDRTLSLPPTFFAKYASGDLMGRVTAAANSGQIISTSMISQVLGSLFSLISFVLLFRYSVVLSLVTILILAVTVTVMALFTRQLNGLSKGMVSSQRIATMWMVQVLSGISKIRTSGAEDRLVAQHQERIRGLVNYSARQTLVMRRLSGFNLAMAAAMPALTYAAIYLFAWSDAGAEITPATYMAFVATYGVVYGSISSLSSTMLPAANSKSSLKLAEPILSTLPESSAGHDRLSKVDGAIELASVTFRYDERTPVVINDLSVKIDVGEFVAIVGSSGSGKSTLVRLLLGFEKPTDGQVLFDGRDIADLDMQDYRRHLGVVMQFGQLLQGSIRDNILAGLSLPDTDILEAARDAALLDDIKAMPMGLSTFIDAATVSGGQAQRILLARTLIRKPKVIILDEATSAMDNHSQAAVTRVLGGLKSTRIVVAHRLSTIASADRILVMKDGKVTEQGTYDELLKAGGEFSQLARAQLVDEPAMLAQQGAG